MARYVDPTPKYTDSGNEPLPNGLLYFFESGTSTQKTTYADVNQTIANPHPLILNGDGSVPNCFYSGAAKVRLATSADVQIWERDPVVGAESSSFGESWNSISVYGLNEVVTFNDLLYVSIAALNQNNNPSTTPASWSQFDLLTRWNVNQTYQVRDPVIGTDYTIYISQVANNLGNDPTVPSANWAASGAGSGAVFAFTDWDLSVSYAAGGANIVTGSNGLYYKSLQAANLNQDPISTPLYWEPFYPDGRNVLINSNFKVNQRAFGGGQPAAGVYGFDRWKGDTLGTRIEQVVENTDTINEAYVISWTGGTGTADVDGVTGLSSGDSFTLNTSANYSVIVPTDATMIKVERGISKTQYTPQGASIGEELALCQRYYEAGNALLNANGANGVYEAHYRPFQVTKRVAPTMAISNLSETGCTGTGADFPNTTDFRVVTQSTVSGQITYNYNWTADAEL